MAQGPEEIAREQIDRMLEQAGWDVQDIKTANIWAKKGVAIGEFPLKTGYGTADYLLYVDGQATGVIEAKKEGTTLAGVEVQSDKYSKGLPDNLPAWFRPLPFCYESTGKETHFTNGFDPEPRSRNIFAFHRPEMLSDWLEDSIPTEYGLAAERQQLYTPDTFLTRVRKMPHVVEEGLWPAQIQAVKNFEKSLQEGRPRALIQMATGSGKTFTAITFIYRLIKFAGARRVLFLVDRANLGRQTLREFQQYVSPYNNFKFNEEFIVQRLTSNTLDTTARVCISTIERLYSMLKGEEIPEEADETSAQGLENVYKEIPPIEYNPAIPIETFDIIVTDECHRSIYNLWRQVLEYFDASIIGLTATPNKQTFGFFNQNLAMEYNHDQAVADGVNVNYDVYRIRTAITQTGSTIDAGFFVDRRDRETREVRWERLDEDLAYAPNQLDRDVVAVDQIRTVIKTFRDKLSAEIFPGRTEVPKTLIFAKDDSHAEDIVKIVREEFAKGNDFCQKITYKTTGRKPEDLIAEFRNSYNPRIAVTVDMIATGTDIKPLEAVLFMRTVKSRTFFEQMKGRGVQIINPHDLQAVTPDAVVKDHFVIIDAVGVCEEDKTDSRPLEKKPSVSFDKLLQAIALGNTDTDVISSIAGRMARMERRLSKEQVAQIKKLSGGLDIRELTMSLVRELHRLTRGEIWDAGKYKDKDGDIIAKYPDGRTRIRFKTVTATKTPQAMKDLVDLWGQSLRERWVHPLIVMAAFNLDFLCIHPFRDGNGRVSRLMLLLQCYHLGFEVGRYISIERLIEENKERYYETLEQSSQGWHEGKHDPWPYINYVLFILKTAYKEFEERVGQIKSPRGAKTELIESAVNSFEREFTVSDLERACPGTSRDMIRRVLRDLQKAGRVECLGRGPGAPWKKKGNTLKRG